MSEPFAKHWTGMVSLAGHHRGSHCSANKTLQHTWSLPKTNFALDNTARKLSSWTSVEARWSNDPNHQNKSTTEWLRRHKSCHLEWTRYWNTYCGFVSLVCLVKTWQITTNKQQKIYLWLRWRSDYILSPINTENQEIANGTITFSCSHILCQMVSGAAQRSSKRCFTIWS